MVGGGLGMLLAMIWEMVSVVTRTRDNATIHRSLSSLKRGNLVPCARGCKRKLNCLLRWVSDREEGLKSLRSSRLPRRERHAAARASACRARTRLASNVNVPHHHHLALSITQRRNSTFTRTGESSASFNFPPPSMWPSILPGQLPLERTM